MTTRLPAGKYWIGDLCYILNEENGYDWGRVARLLIVSGRSGGIFETQGVKFYIGRTLHGDGCYYDDEWDENKYGVDSGTIGCVLVDTVNGDWTPTQLGHVHEIKEEFEPHCDNGLFNIGHVRIDTGDWP